MKKVKETGKKQTLRVCLHMFEINVQSTPALEFMTLIQQHYKKHHSTSFYAKKMGLHPNSLNTISKRYLGRSAKSVIDAALMAEAKNLLFQTGLSEARRKSSTLFFMFNSLC